jgi:hypothetical protein
MQALLRKKVDTTRLGELLGSIQHGVIKAITSDLLDQSYRLVDMLQTVHRMP